MEWAPKCLQKVSENERKKETTNRVCDSISGRLVFRLNKAAQLVGKEEKKTETKSLKLSLMSQGIVHKQCGSH